MWTSVTEHLKIQLSNVCSIEQVLVNSVGEPVAPKDAGSVLDWDYEDKYGDYVDLMKTFNLTNQKLAKFKITMNNGKEYLMDVDPTKLRHDI